ncbi:discoidin domain-containing receptor 2-like [Lampetra planeri]
MSGSGPPSGPCSGLVLLIVSAAAVNGQFLLSSCRYPLGVQDGLIPDDDITASSQWYSSTAAKYGRLEGHGGDGAWCPAGPLLPGSAEFLQVTLPAAHVVALVATQGRHAGGHGNEFASHFRLQYSRDGQRWSFWHDRHGEEVLQGNVDTSGVVVRDLTPPLIARHLRFVPLADRSMSVCMRVEAFGCTWDEGLTSYSLPRGHMMSRGAGIPPLALEDDSYDGYSTRSYVSGGLGQLTDGMWGGDDLALTSDPLVAPGYDYVGWNSSTLSYVETEFIFDRSRNFSLMQVHCSNQFDHGVREFREARCSFRPSVSSEWEDDPVTYAASSWGPRAGTRPDPKARFVPVPLLGRTGIAIKCRFYFADTWLLISEVSFQFQPGPDGKSEGPEAPSETSAIPGQRGLPGPAARTVGKTTGKGVTSMSSATTSSSSSSSLSSSIPPAATAAGPPRGRAFEPGTLETPSSGGTGALVASLVVIIVVLIAIIALMLWRQHWKKVLRMVTHRRLSDDLITVSLSGPHDTALIGNPRPNAYEGSAEDGGPAEGRAGGYCRVSPADLSWTSSSGRRLPSPLARRKLPELPQSAEDAAGGGDGGDGGYAEPDLTKAAPRHGRGAGDGGDGAGTDGGDVFPRSGTRVPALDSVPPYAEAVIVSTGVTLPGAGWDGVYAVPVGGSCGPPTEFPRHCLKFREKLGEGQFGEVHLCEVEGMDPDTSAALGLCASNGKPALVAVKTLHPDASQNAKSDFLKEVKIMSRMCDPNVMRLIGACLDVPPLCMITDYMEGGDLNQFLSRHRLAEPGSPQPNGIPATPSMAPLICMERLLWVAVQVASGMRHLATLGYVHRDLATRNCLVGTAAGTLSVRIADFGMSRNLYQGDYYRVQGRAVLPIRWLAWESILLGKFTGASDVWAFGVTLWEVFTLCRTQPYCGMTDEQVVENAGEFFRNQGKQVFLPEPEACPERVRALMLRCWVRDAAQRPDFGEIHRALSAERNTCLRDTATPQLSRPLTSIA